MCNINLFLTQTWKKKTLVTIPMVPIFVNVIAPLLMTKKF